MVPKPTSTLPSPWVPARHSSPAPRHDSPGSRAINRVRTTAMALSKYHATPGRSRGKASPRRSRLRSSSHRFALNWARVASWPPSIRSASGLSTHRPTVSRPTPHPRRRPARRHRWPAERCGGEERDRRVAQWGVGVGLDSWSWTTRMAGSNSTSSGAAGSSASGWGKCSTSCGGTEATRCTAPAPGRLPGATNRCAPLRYPARSRTTPSLRISAYLHASLPIQRVRTSSNMVHPRSGPPKSCFGGPFRFTSSSGDIGRSNSPCPHGLRNPVSTSRARSNVRTSVQPASWARAAIR